MLHSIMGLESFLTFHGKLLFTFAGVLLLSILILGCCDKLSDEKTRLLDLLILLIGGAGFLGIVFENRPLLYERERNYQLLGLEHWCSDKDNFIMDMEGWQADSLVSEWINNNKNLFLNSLASRDSISMGILIPIQHTNNNIVLSTEDAIKGYNNRISELNLIESQANDAIITNITYLYLYPIFLLISVLLSLIKWVDDSKLLQFLRKHRPIHFQ